MSSPAQGGPSVPKEEKEKKGLGKVLSRMKTVLRRGETSKRRQSTLLSGSEPQATGAAAATSSPTPAPAQTPATVPIEPARTREADKPTWEGTKVPRSQLYEERAKKLSERFGLEIKPSEWYTTEGHALRVDKPIRMRVHRKCHNCETLFGQARECPKCQHPKCKQCPRVPPKRTEAEKEESRKRRAALLKERADNAPIVPDWSLTERAPLELRKPAKKGNQDLVYKKARQRIRRTCCMCERQYTNIQGKVCEGCEHVRCTDCPRDPAKKDKYPYGYPGDAFGKNSVPHYKCPSCTHVFPKHDTDDFDCPQCQHKPDEWKRLRPRKVEPEPDPEVWKSVQLKLANLNL